MKKTYLLLCALIFTSTLSSCGNNENTISIAASKLPHAKILNEAVAPILEEQGYKLDVKVLDWTLQNNAVANNEYDANYFQHIPYLNSNNFTGDNELTAVAKVHYEKLCLYASNTEHKTIENGDTIEIVNDIANIERALLLLESYNILTINESNYDENNEFKNFNISNPNNCVTFCENYTNCSLTCIQETYLCASLEDYNFGVIPGNTALVGLNNLSSRIVYSEQTESETIDKNANIIACKKTNINSPKIQALVKALGDESIETYINDTFGESIIYYYKDLLNN